MSHQGAKWIWASEGESAPVNRFHYFRRVVELKDQPSGTLLHFAADTNAQLWVNGHLVCRKVTRYAEERIHAEAIQVGPYLKKGKNTIVVLHHNWGPITCFMRTGNRHAGLWVEADWLQSDDSWRWTEASEFMKHEVQFIGHAEDARRLRFPVVLDAEQRDHFIFDEDFDDSDWSHAYVVKDGPWPDRPYELETNRQREHDVVPPSVLAAGFSESVFDARVESIAANLTASKLRVDAALKSGFERLPLQIDGEAGETLYVTFDFTRPVHGFPFVEIEGAQAGVCIDFGYGEIARPLYRGELFVREDGWIDTEAVIGKYYADRCFPKKGEAHRIELPDERTARWLTLHFRFTEDSTLRVNRVGMVKSQYPIQPLGTFSCGDLRMDQIVNLCKIHAEVTMSDAYVDTPGREDGQWIEDTRLRAMIGASWFNDTALRRFCIRTFAEGEDGEGDFHPFYPSNYPFSPGPVDWSVQWVYMVYDEYLWSGDTDIIHENLEKMQRFWRSVKVRTMEDGLFFADFMYSDIRNDADTTKTQSSGLLTAYLIERLERTIEMADAISALAWKDELTKLLNRLIEGFRRYHVVSKTNELPAHVATRYETNGSEVDRGFHQATQVATVLADILSEEDAVDVIDFAFPEPNGIPPNSVHRWNNPTFAYRSLKALSQVGYIDRAVLHLFERYEPYLPGHPRNLVPLRLQGPLGGPLPEYWISREDIDCEVGEVNPHHPVDETGSHGWGAVVLQWLHDTLLGVSLISPGGARIRIAPDAGSLPYVAGTTMSPKGPVSVYWDPQQLILQVILPPEVVAEVLYPSICRGLPITVVKHQGLYDLKTDTCILEGAGSYEFHFYK